MKGMLTEKWSDFVGESFACENVDGIIIIISRDQW